MPLAVLLVRVERGSCRPVSRAQRGEKCCAVPYCIGTTLVVGAHLPVTDTVRFVPISPNHVSMVPLTGVL